MERSPNAVVNGFKANLNLFQTFKTKANKISTFYSLTMKYGENYTIKKVALLMRLLKNVNFLFFRNLSGIN